MTLKRLLVVVVGLILLAGLTPTSVAAQTPVSIFNSGAPPPSGDPDPGAVEVGVRFRSDVNGFILGLRFYKSATNGGVHIGNLWTNGGVLLATATFTAEAASGWQLVTFATPVAIAANTTYVASYHTNVGHYGATSNYFAAGGVINSPLRALQDGVDGPNGVYRYGATSGFPSQSFQSTNYWVDVLFSTSSGTQTPPVTVNSITPAANATGVSPTAPVTATFNAMMNASSVNSTTFTLRDAAGNLVPAQAGAGGETPTSTLTPLVTLASGTKYTATVMGGPAGVRDESGDTMSADFSWSFTTSGTPPPTQTCPCTIWTASTTTASGPDSDPSAVEVGLRFRSDTAGFITGVRFYKFASNSGTHTGSLWSKTGTLLATATFSSESGTGWQQVTFGSPVAIAANTTYVASYHTNVGHYAANSNYFLVGFNNGLLHALADGVDGPSGVYHYGSSSAFPSDTYQSANYWVDVVFSTTGAGDTTPPVVTAVTPASGTTGVSVATVVTATFNEMVNASTVNASTFQLRDAAGNIVPATAYAGGETPTATLAPTSPLAYLTTYTATVNGGASGVKDLAGNPMAGIATWSFTTGANAPPPLPPCPCTIWNPSTTTASGPDSDSNAVEVGLRFRSDVAGFITGLRFYQFGPNTGTHSGSLWSNTGTLLATSTFFQGEGGGGGWQQLTFSVPVAITANTTYVASYHTNVGRYAANTNYFVAGFDNPPLHAMADGVDGPSGVYRYGDTSGFPDQTYLSTNYWIDVNFSNAPTAPPTVTSVTPASGATGVSTGALVTATFSTFMDPATITGATFQLYTAGGTFVPATVTVYDGMAFLRTTALLAPGTTYSAVVVGGSVGPSVKALGGTPMTAAYWWTFTTAP